MDADTQTQPSEELALAKELAELEAENRRLRERIRLLEKALFGPRSERLIDDGAGQGKFDDLLAELDALTKQAEEEERKLEQEKEKQRAKRTNREKRKPRKLEELVPEDLPVKEVILDVPEEDKICLETGEQMVKIGEERSRKLAYQPGQYLWIEYIRPKYAAPKNPSQGVVCGQMPECAIPGCHYDESFIADIVIGKCAYHLPLYRQEEKLRHSGIQVSRQTLNRLYLKAAEVLEPIYAEMKADILGRGIIFTDDTPVKLQVKGNGKTVTGRMWVYVGGGVGPPYRVFEFTRDRRKVRPKEFLGNYRGYIHADAYKGYEDLFEIDGIDECACWMHVRRKFIEAEDAPVALRRSILAGIRLLYRYEREARAGSEEDILRIRAEKEAPLIDLIFDRAKQALINGEILPQSDFAKAIGYLLNRGDALKTYLNDPNLRPDNGESERAIRPLAIGRRNWLFVGSQNGGDATGILLSLIQSCRLLDIDPTAYLEDVLRRINGHNSNRVHELLPHNWKPAQKLWD